MGHGSQIRRDRRGVEAEVDGNILRPALRRIGDVEPWLSTEAAAIVSAAWPNPWPAGVSETRVQSRSAIPASRPQRIVACGGQGGGRVEGERGVWWRRIGQGLHSGEAGRGEQGE